jgi:flagellar basal-body rod modification protein FlgD
VNVQSSTAATATFVSASDAAKASLNYDSFLKLLMEQLKSQDPTNPVDQSQTLAQLAQFSNVEQTIKLNEKLETLLQQSGISQSVNLIGKMISSLNGQSKGRVAAIETGTGGIVAILDSGVRLPVAEGVRIS